MFGLTRIQSKEDLKSTPVTSKDLKQYETMIDLLSRDELVGLLYAEIYIKEFMEQDAEKKYKEAAELNLMLHKLLDKYCKVTGEKGTTVWESLKF